LPIEIHDPRVIYYETSIRVTYKYTVIFRETNAQLSERCAELPVA